MRTRKIRTMRNVWDELAGRASRRARAQGVQGAERLALAGGLVRVQSGCERQTAGTTTAKVRPAVSQHDVHPWVFRRAAAKPGARVRGHVKPLVQPKANIRKRLGAGEFVVLYSLPHVLQDSIRIVLDGDVLRLTAHGTDPDKGAPFEVFSEALLPEVLSEPRLQHVYTGTVLEVLIGPAHGSRGKRDAEPKWASGAAG